MLAARCGRAARRARSAWPRRCRRRGPRGPTSSSTRSERAPCPRTAGRRGRGRTAAPAGAGAPRATRRRRGARPAAVLDPRPAQVLRDRPARAPASFSTNTADAAPRESASMPPAPLPANRSSTTASVELRLEDPEQGLLHAVRERARAGAGRGQPDAPGGAGDHAARVGHVRPRSRDRPRRPGAASRPVSSWPSAGWSAGRRPRSSSSPSAQPRARVRELPVSRAGERGHPQPRQAALRQTQDVALAAELEVPLGQLEPVASWRRRPAAARTRSCPSAAALTSTQNEASGPAADAPPELVELGQAEPLRALDDHHRRLRDVDADLDDGRAHEHVEVAVAEAAHLGVAVGGPQAAVDEPDPERRQQLRQPRELRLRGRGPGRLEVLVRELVVARPARRPPRPGGGHRRADPRHHDERPPALGRLRRGPAPRCPRGRPGGGCRCAPATRPAGAACEGRDVEVRVQHLAQRARDRGRGHQQDVGGAAARLVLEGPALLHAEPVLLVHDGEREVVERDGILEERVRPHDDLRLPGADRLDGLAPRLRRQRAREQDDADAQVLEERCRPSRGAGGRAGPSGRAAPPAARRARRPRAPRPRRRSCPTRRRPGPGAASGTARARSPRISSSVRRLVGRSARSPAPACARSTPPARPGSGRRPPRSTGIGAVWARPRARRRPTMPSCSASSSSKARRRRAASRASKVCG